MKLKNVSALIVVSILRVIFIILPIFRSKLIPCNTHFKTCICAITASLFLISCGGGTTPKYLSEPRVDVSKWTPTKEVVLKKDGLNLVKAIVLLQDSTEFLIVSDKQICKLSNNKLNKECIILTPELSDLSIVRNTSEEPSYIVGGGIWGKPSAAVFDINGQLKWKKESGFDAMGKTAVLDDGEERFVVLENKNQELLYLNFETGEVARKGSAKRIIGSADFTGDGHYELLAANGETDFAVFNGKAQEISRLTLSDDYWYEPVLTSSALPLVVISAEEILEVYDSKLKIVKKYKAAGAGSKMHVVAATFIGNGPDAPFAALYKGRGGWHRSILYVFSATGELVYKEIIVDSFQSITAVPSNDKKVILIGGRNEVIRYSFQK
ncbi:hypothetical protein [Flavobacterium degerlachei]|jgi:hypothetical protein|uniref:Uncharacterized protein n=1 Tax=Flavobacterium degerlachei TaxID=229203 RepID=A0A1H3BVW1_9FLAO|nr:hypothetical protein [Flavobacterium degerlachei]SDX46132.1 hypothetical protein SAMN05444338_110136 [Flavobacterium degerlachei]